MAANEPYFDWRTSSRCKELDSDKFDRLFFPSNGRSINKAKKFCGECVVEEQCLEFALITNAKGIWAGTTVKDREKIKKFKEQLDSPVVENPRQTIKKSKTKRRNFSVT